MASTKKSTKKQASTKKTASTPVQTRRVEGPVFVILPNGEQREYSKASHGQHYKTLAKQLAENPKYKGARIIGDVK